MNFWSFRGNSPFICLAWKLLAWISRGMEMKRKFIFIFRRLNHIWRVLGNYGNMTWFIDFSTHKTLRLNFTTFCTLFFLLIERQWFASCGKMFNFELYNGIDIKRNWLKVKRILNLFSLNDCSPNNKVETISMLRIFCDTHCIIPQGFVIHGARCF